MLPYSVVDFVESGSVAIIPSKWFTGPEEDECYWPPVRTVNIEKAVKEAVNPNPEWSRYNIRVLGKAENYALARKKLLKAEICSDLQTDSDWAGKKRKRRPRQMSSSESDIEGTTHDEAAEVPAPSVPASLQSSGIAQATPGPSSVCRVLQRSQNTEQLITSQQSRALFSTKTPRRTVQSALAQEDLKSTHVLSDIRYDTQEPQQNEPVTTVRDAMFIRVLTVLEEVKATQKVHGAMIQSLLRQSDKTSTASCLPEGAEFPLETPSDVEAMEQKLLDPDFSKDVVSFLGDIGGRSVEEATRRVMSFILTNDLALKFNFVGRHGKLQFGTLRLFDVFYGGLKRNVPTKDISRRDAERVVSKWLCGARDRGGKRALRGSQKHDAAAGPQP
ncbi:uncharacterized protein [Paramormyrops kingsleyae]